MSYNPKSGKIISANHRIVRYEGETSMGALYCAEDEKDVVDEEGTSERGTYPHYLGSIFPPPTRAKAIEKLLKEFQNGTLKQPLGPGTPYQVCCLCLLPANKKISVEDCQNMQGDTFSYMAHEFQLLFPGGQRQVLHCAFTAINSSLNQVFLKR